MPSHRAAAEVGRIDRMSSSFNSSPLQDVPWLAPALALLAGKGAADSGTKILVLDLLTFHLFRSLRIFTFLPLELAEAIFAGNILLFGLGHRFIAVVHKVVE